MRVDDARAVVLLIASVLTLVAAVIGLVMVVMRASGLP